MYDTIILHSLRAVLMLGVLCVVRGAVAAEGTPVDESSRKVLTWQVALEREGFSPGILDGKPGRKLTLAITEYQRGRGLPATGTPDDMTAEALDLGAISPVTRQTVSATDVSTVTGPTPKSWYRKSELKRLGHESLDQALAERFHCTVALLNQLNPGVNLNALKAGDSFHAPTPQARAFRSVARLEVDQSGKTIRAYAADNKLVALLHCSIAKEAKKRPVGDGRVVVVSHDPHYNFDPKMWPEVKDVTRKLLIPPGPNNPVGLCWIGLSFKGYGIHGTPVPEMIGKTGSHGCIRLTNWDATRLGNAVTPGIKVTFKP